MRAYVAGPMTGIPQFNFPAFDEAASYLREQGWEIVSPAELDDPETRAAALASPDGAPGTGSTSGETWGDFLARDVKLIADGGIQAIVCLPGWEHSKGARLETFVGRLAGLTILDYETLEEVSQDLVETAHSCRREFGAQDPTGFLPGSKGPRALATHCPAVEYIHVGPEGKHSLFTPSEVRIVNEHTGGEKGKKPEAFNLLPWAQLDEVARLYAFGAAKYDAHNWTRGYDWSLSFDSLVRHAREFWLGKETDEETGCSHMASVVFHALALMHFAEHHRDLDDRPPIARAA